MEVRWTSRAYLSCCFNSKLLSLLVLLFVTTIIVYHYATMNLTDCDSRTLVDSSKPVLDFIAVQRTINVTDPTELSFNRDAFVYHVGPSEVPTTLDLRYLRKQRHFQSKLRKASDPRTWRHMKSTRLRKLKLKEEYFRLNTQSNKDRWKFVKQAKNSKSVKINVQSIVNRTSTKIPKLSNQLTGDNVITRVRLAAKINLTTKRRLPQALIIGVKKGGTRALLEFIRLHPDVRAVGPETHFFDRHYHKGLHWYRQQMPPTLESQLTMEKTPSYFVTRDVPRRIFSMAHNIKLLVVVRDPVTRAISDYAQTVSKRRHMRSFDELAFLNNVTGIVDTSWGAIKIGVYVRHLENWLQYFPLQQFHFVSGERLIKDPAGEIGKVQDFLGVRRIVTENHFYFNETKGFPCLKKSEGNGSPRCLGKTKGRIHPNVGNSTLQHLRNFFRPFNMKFYQMTGVDFGWP